jgi:hypothetical protein
MNKILVKVKQFLLFLSGLAIGGILVNTFKNQIIDDENFRVAKFKGYYNLLEQWLLLKQQGKSLEQYFLNHNYKTIAIYGMGELGNRLLEELKYSDINVKYGIDKNNSAIKSDIDVYRPGDNLEAVDAVVVSAIFAFYEIEDELKKVINYPIINLEDVVYELV